MSDNPLSPRRQRIVRKAIPLDSGGEKLPPVFFLAGDHLLRNPVFYVEEVWRPARELNISSRTWLSRMGLVYEYEGRILNRDGRLIDPLPTFDYLFPEDPGSWFRKFLEVSREAPDRPRVFRNSRQEALQRLRWIELFLRLHEERFG